MEHRITTMGASSGVSHAYHCIQNKTGNWVLTIKIAINENVYYLWKHISSSSSLLLLTKGDHTPKYMELQWPRLKVRVKRHGLIWRPQLELRHDMYAILVYIGCRVSIPTNGCETYLILLRGMTPELPNATLRLSHQGALSAIRTTTSSVKLPQEGQL